MAVCATEPPTISGGFSAVVGIYATYTCNYGYRMKGSPTIECSEGAWVAPFPECILINSNSTYVLDFMSES